MIHFFWEAKHPIHPHESSFIFSLEFGIWTYLKLHFLTELKPSFLQHHFIAIDDVNQCHSVMTVKVVKTRLLLKADFCMTNKLENLQCK